MKIPVMLAVLAVVVSGCTKTVAEMSYSERQALGAEIVQRCIAQGVKLGTKEMDACTYAEAEREVTTRNMSAIREQRALAGASAGLKNASTGYNRAAASPGSMNRTVTCRSVPSPAGMAKVRCN